MKKSRRIFLGLVAGVATGMAVSTASMAQIQYINGADDGRVGYQVIGDYEKIGTVMSKRLKKQDHIPFDDALRKHLFTGWRIYYHVHKPKYLVSWSDGTSMTEVLNAITRHVPVYLRITPERKTVEVMEVKNRWKGK